MAEIALVSRGVPLGPRVDQILRLDRHELGIVALEKLRRDADLDDLDPSATLARGRHEVAHLRRREGDGEVGVDGGAGNASRVGRQPGRHVDGDAACFQPVDVFDDPERKAGRGACQTGSEDSIHDDVGAEHLLESEGPLVVGGDGVDAKIELQGRLKIIERIWREIFERCENDRARFVVEIDQRPEQHQPVTAVVAFATNDDDSTSSRVLRCAPPWRRQRRVPRSP